MKFGAHVSIAGGIYNAPYRASELGCGCFQIFSRPPQGGKPSLLDTGTVKKFLNECSVHDFSDYYVHAPYFINIASADKRIMSRSIETVKEELNRAGMIGAKYLIVHLGSAGKGERTGALNNVIKAITEVLNTCSTTAALLVENSAGQGETIGSLFAEIAEIIYRAGHPDLGVCLDTAHLFAAGYDIRTKVALDKTLTEFSQIVGLGRLKLIHCNDSKASLGERKDRHEHIGQGRIGIEGFRAIVNEPRLQGLDLIIETPLEKVGDDIKNLENLKALKTKE